jgi:beta-exotoxin I transport system ATP-binding protein
MLNSPSPPCIETFSLSKSYGHTKAVSGLDLKIECGEVFGFLGPNGAGKTTTIRMLLALQRQTSGRASVFGLDSQRDSVEIHARTGYLPGDLELFPRMTGRQHISWFARARAIQGLGIAGELVERFDVVMDRPARELSKGNRQKIGLVLAFMHKPDLLILDEPTSGLDPLMQQEFEQLVRETVHDRRTVFLSSHELDEVQRLADRVGIIRSGHLVTTDTVAALRKNSPLKMEVRFPQRVDAAVFSGVEGVSVTKHDETRMEVEVVGPVAPLLRVLSDHNAVDIISRRANLDELFMQFYRGSDDSGDPGAH